MTDSYHRGGLHLADLRRSSTNSKLFGVCGGIAEWLGISALVVRIIVIAMAFLLPPFTFVGYFALAFLLDKSPRSTSTSSGDWTNPAGSPIDSASAAMHALERRFSALEARLRRAEAEVTSKGFRINRELREVRR